MAYTDESASEDEALHPSSLSRMDEQMPEKFVTDHYERLNRSRGALRLLNLRAGSRQNPHIEGELINYDSRQGHEIPSYEALSWNWGTEENTAYIAIRKPEERKIYAKMIKPTLFKALKILRHPSKDRYLWIDTICIDQDYLDEKNHQVELMSSIYGKASRVCVWLGEETKKSRVALRFIHDEILQFQNFDNLCDNKDNTQKWLALLDLMQRPWFSRRWVVQEVALASKVVLYCGPDKISWNKFAIAVELFVEVETATHRLSEVMKKDPRFYHVPGWFQYVSALGASLLVDATGRLFRDDKVELARPRRRRRRNVLQQQTDHVSDSDASTEAEEETRALAAQAQTMRNNGQMTIKPTERGHPLLDLQFLVTFLAIFEASVEHDTIYALLAIAKDTKPVAADLEDEEEDGARAHTRRMLEPFTQRKRYPVNYKADYVEVCKDFIQFCIFQSMQRDPARALDVICRPWATDEKTLQGRRMDAISRLNDEISRQRRRDDAEQRRRKKYEETLKRVNTSSLILPNGTNVQSHQMNGEHSSADETPIKTMLRDIEKLKQKDTLPSWVPQLKGATYNMYQHPGVDGIKMGRMNADMLVGLPSVNQRNYTAAESKALDLKALRFRRRIKRDSTPLETERAMAEKKITDQRNVEKNRQRQQSRGRRASANPSRSNLTINPTLLLNGEQWQRASSRRSRSRPDADSRQPSPQAGRRPGRSRSEERSYDRRNGIRNELEAPMSPTNTSHATNGIVNGRRSSSSRQDGRRYHNASLADAEKSAAETRSGMQPEVHFLPLKPRVKVPLQKQHYSMYVSGFELDTIQQVEQHSQNGAIPREWADLAEWMDPLNDPCPERFWRTLVADRGKDGRNPPIYYARACQECFEKGGLRGGAVDTSGLMNNERNSIVAQFCRRVQAVIWNRALAKTERGTLALVGKNVQAGDKVCILYGCSVPVILRQRRERKTPKEMDSELDWELDYLMERFNRFCKLFVTRRKERRAKFAVRKKQAEAIWHEWELARREEWLNDEEWQRKWIVNLQRERAHKVKVNMRQATGKKPVIVEVTAQEPSRGATPTSKATPSSKPEYKVAAGSVEALRNRLEEAYESKDAFKLLTRTLYHGIMVHRDRDFGAWKAEKAAIAKTELESRDTILSEPQSATIRHTPMAFPRHNIAPPDVRSSLLRFLPPKEINWRAFDLQVKYGRIWRKIRRAAKAKIDESTSGKPLISQRKHTMPQASDLRKELTRDEKILYEEDMREQLKRIWGQDAYWSYTMLGEAYIHGMMDGGAIAYQNGENKEGKPIKPKVFEIR